MVHGAIDGEGEWVPPGCQAFQDKQYKGDFIYRNGCAFSGDTKKTECTGSDFDDAPGCAVLVYAGAGPTGAAALNVKGEVTSYEMLQEQSSARQLFPVSRRRSLPDASRWRT